jgi:aminodeoxyfutalosine deaminase
VRAVRARAVWTPDGLRDDAVVDLDGQRVVGVRPARDGDPAPLEGLLIPGLINAHTHLEFAWAHGLVPGGKGLADWVLALSALTRPEDVHREAHGRAAAVSMVDLGVAGVSDISNRGDTASWLADAGLHGVVQHELLTMDPALLPGQMRAVSLGVRWTGSTVVTRPSPHGVYSTLPELLVASGSVGGAVGSIHVSEDPAEAMLLAHREGPLAELLAHFGVDWSAWVAPRCSPVAYLDSLGLLGRELMLVHGVHASEQDRTVAIAAGSPVCLCPRSNLHIGETLPAAPAWIAAGGMVALGTDSLASCPDLDPLGEVATLMGYFPAVQPCAWLAAATSGGADALGLRHLGRIRAGAAPGLVLLEEVGGLADLRKVPTRRWVVRPAASA